MWIAEIGEKIGATDRYFRPEDNAGALPPEYKVIKTIDQEVSPDQLKLRLYCIVLSEEVVILVNGGIKESQLTQKSPSCWKEFMFTSNIASQISKMEREGNLELRGKMIKRTKNFKLSYKKE